MCINIRVDVSHDRSVCVRPNHNQVLPLLSGCCFWSGQGNMWDGDGGIICQRKRACVCVCLSLQGERCEYICKKEHVHVFKFLNQFARWRLHNLSRLQNNFAFPLVLSVFPTSFLLCLCVWMGSDLDSGLSPRCFESFWDVFEAPRAPPTWSSSGNSWYWQDCYRGIETPGILNLVTVHILKTSLTNSTSRREEKGRRMRVAEGVKGIL